MLEESKIFDIRNFDLNRNMILDNFHRILNIIPEDQTILHIAPDTKVTDALRIMKKNNFSQLPVVFNGEVQGVFSYRSFAQGISKIHLSITKFENLIVENFLESLQFKTIHQSLEELIKILNNDDSVLIGNPEKLQAVVSSIDVLQYLYKVSHPFVVISEIELTLRVFIQSAFNDDELKTVMAECISKKNPPEKIEDLTFFNYIQIVLNENYWERFDNLFSDDKEIVEYRLRQIKDLRNKVFHFKGDLTIEDYEDLINSRDWFFIKAKKLKANRL